MSLATCVGCKCTDTRACPGGCSWLGVNRDDGTGVCSKCAKHLAAWRHQQAEPDARSLHDLLCERMQIGPLDI